MKIGIIGAGMVSRSVATVAIARGYEIMLSNSRSRDTLFTLTRTLGCLGGTPDEAARFGDIVLVAVPFKNYRDVPVASLAGKIVLDANNYYPDRDGHISELDAKKTTTSELLAAHLPESRIVKAFNAIMAPDVERDGRPHGDRDRRALPIVGDDAEAKAVVANLHDKMGFDVVDAGSLAEGWRFEEGTPVYCVPMTADALRLTLSTTTR